MKDMLLKIDWMHTLAQLDTISLSIYNIQMDHVRRIIKVLSSDNFQTVQAGTKLERCSPVFLVRVPGAL